ncbi:putative adenosylcobalamin-dependent ribonucleoside-triphosphate reductase [Martensiomyces pterosporus]|nr:putative adenosylcobalamin-dependent ribonucleoside-triphosphate reductase [Martensiomyces pterosporus]
MSPPGLTSPSSAATLSPSESHAALKKQQVAHLATPSSDSDRFSLDPSFVSAYEKKLPPFGFNGLGEIVYRRTYSRLKPDGKREKWFETIARVVNGTFRLQQEWLLQNRLRWDPSEAQKKAQVMYDKIFHMKFLPPGRGLWAMGSPLTEERRLFAALNNCAFVSTGRMWDRDEAPSRPFTFLMDAAMLGVGVGFDTKGSAAAKERGICVQDPSSNTPTAFVIPDSREGWVQSLGLLIDSYLDVAHTTPASRCSYSFDYSQIRPAGLPIKGFGGITSGPDPLRELHDQIRSTLARNISKPLSVTSIVDLMNLIGKCVVSGNVRRTAEIAFGDPHDDEYVDLKNYQANPHRAAFGWTSNNSVFATVGMDYKEICRRVQMNGEPGFQWMQNAREYARMADPATDKDWRIEGANPCNEQCLESYELCCLVETFPSNHHSLEDYLETLESAFLYAKTVTLMPTHWPETNRVMLRNRRIGTSISGVAQFITARGVHELRTWLDAAYARVQEIDSRVSERFCVPRSVKTTSVKPSGTVSLLAGATPGMHYPESRFCIRRVRVSKLSDLLPALRSAGYYIEDDVVDKSSVVVEIPIDHGEGVRGLKDVSMWEQLALAALLQKHWSDNQVSSTITFDPQTEGPQLSHALDYYQYQLKGISFLPRMDYGAFPQMPYEAIDEKRYREMVKGIKSNVSLHLVEDGDQKEPEAERYCSNDLCLL